MTSSTASAKAHLRDLLDEARTRCNTQRSGPSGHACASVMDLLRHLDAYHSSWDVRELILYVESLLEPLRRDTPRLTTVVAAAPRGHDAFLERYLEPSVPFSQALHELQAGRKRTHWMWWVFPQLCVVSKGVAVSATSSRYCFESEDQAEAYARHDVLGWQYMEAVRAVLDYVRVPGHALSTLFPNDVDVVKLISSLTLFEAVFGKLGRAYPVGPEGYTATDVSHMITDVLRGIRAQRCCATLGAIA